MQIHIGIVIILILAAATLAGCTTKAKARAEAQKAFMAAQAQALQSAQAQPASVTISGQVRNRVIPWQEGLTLAQAIDAAVYTGFSDPRLIRLRRGPEFLDISPNELLQGKVNPPLEAGDVIELQR